MRLRTRTLTALIVRTTKLKETDLVVTLVAEDGSQHRAVANGARKPGSRFGSCLEVGRCARLLLAQGRSLDVVKEAKAARGLPDACADVEHEAGLVVMCDLLSRITVVGQPLKDVHPMTLVAIDALGRVEAASVPLITAAQLVKATALAGFRPRVRSCAVCARPLPAPDPASPCSETFSYEEGGRVCGDCAREVDTVLVPAGLVAGVDSCLRSTFSELVASPAPATSQTGLGLLRFCQRWLLAHLDIDMRSLSFMLTCGLYS